MKPPCHSEPDLWFSDNEEEIQLAKAVCLSSDCPLFAECGERGWGEQHGVYGGMSAADRQALDPERYAVAVKEGEEQSRQLDGYCAGLDPLAWYRVEQNPGKCLVASCVALPKMAANKTKRARYCTRHDRQYHRTGNPIAGGRRETNPCVTKGCVNRADKNGRRCTDCVAARGRARRERKDKVLALLEQGLTHAQVAKQLGISRDSVGGIVRWERRRM